MAADAVGRRPVEPSLVEARWARARVVVVVARGDAADVGDVVVDFSLNGGALDAVVATAEGTPRMGEDRDGSRTAVTTIRSAAEYSG